MCSDKIQIGGQDFRIEVAKEVDLCGPNQDLKDVRCDKNPGHGEFIPFNELNLNHLPPACRTVDVLHEIKTIGKRVVKIVVNDDNGRQTCGTGFVIKRRNKYLILTNNHVIKDGRYAKNSVIEFNFDSHDSEKICCKGVDLRVTCPTRDVTSVLFEPTEFLNTMDIVDTAIYDPTIEITYINGTVFKHNHLLLVDGNMIRAPFERDPNDPEIKDVNVRFVDGTVSKLISPYITFHPIPDNIQSVLPGYHHPTVELVPDEGEDTIPLQGETIYSFNKITIKLSESLTKQEAEKCLIYFPDGSVSRGTGLYFDMDINYVESELNPMTGCDRDMYLHAFGNCQYSVMFKPIPSFFSTLLRDDSLYPNDPMIVIGHPHGAPKMVSFGKYLGDTLTNNADQTIECIEYSCNTCPGSSGSPIFFLKCIFNVCSSTPHFCGKSASDWQRQNLGINNVNMAWGPD